MEYRNIIVDLLLIKKHFKMFEYGQRHHQARTTCQKFANFHKRITKWTPWQPAKLHLTCKLQNNGRRHPGSAAPEIRHMQAAALCSEARSSLQYACRLYVYRVSQISVMLLCLMID